MNILITGGAGFIGSHTARRLRDLGHKVRVIDILDPQIHGTNKKFPSTLRRLAECVLGDVRRPDDMRLALRDVDAIYHFASLTGVGQSMYEIRSYVETNCLGTAVLLDELIRMKKKPKKLILASSRAIYGEGAGFCGKCGPIACQPRAREDLDAGRFEVLCGACRSKIQTAPTSENLVPAPISLYGWTKEIQEKLLQHAGKTYGLDTICLRYFNVYGSGQSLQNPYTGIVSIFFSRLMAQKEILLYERGEPIRDFIHVSDVVEANVLALQRNLLPGATINVGSGTPITVSQLAEGLLEASGRSTPLVPNEDFRVGDIRSCYADTRVARDQLGFEARISLQEGLRDFVTWALQQQTTDLLGITIDELHKHGLFKKAG